MKIRYNIKSKNISGDFEPFCKTVAFPKVCNLFSQRLVENLFDTGKITGKDLPATVTFSAGQRSLDVRVDRRMVPKYVTWMSPDEQA